MLRIMTACLLGLVLTAGCEKSSQQTKSPSGKPNRPSPHAHEPGGAPEKSESLGNKGGPVDLEKITLQAPAGWERRAPSSGFVLAEFDLPKAEGDERDGRLTVSTAGGDIEMNIERWRSQFGGKPKDESRRTIEASGLEITLVDLSGDFQDQRGPFAPATMQPDSRMLAAIIPVEGELFFVKAVGPEKTIAAEEEKFVAFVESVKLR